MASKSRFVKAEEFAGKGLVIEILAVEKIKKGKFGETLQVKLLDVKDNKERLWGITGQRAGAAVMSMMAKGIKRMVIWTKGRGMNTQYFAKPVGTRDMALRPIQDGIRSKDHRQKRKVKSTGGRKAKR